MPISTANSRLRKMLLYKYLRICGEHICYRCSLPIEDIDELSIEHKDAWLNNPQGRKLFFDLDNISFSHRVCNSSAGKTYKNGIHPSKGQISVRRIVAPKGMSWCGRGKHFEPTINFGKDKYTWDGLKWECRVCRNLNRKERYRQGKTR